jgi:hypothetical protein
MFVSPVMSEPIAAPNAACRINRPKPGDRYGSSRLTVLPMSISTLLRYLIGDRAAILAIAAHPSACLLGLVFVLSAGLAREYDGEDLLHEPWHLLLPFAASLIASYLLFLVLCAERRSPIGPAYRSFLGLFWLTAPLAWLYAIPYERFLDPLAATQANLATLAVVALWRVALMVRVGVVLMEMTVWKALVRVLVYADGVVAIALGLLPFPLIDLMGGARLSQAESVVRDTALQIFCTAVPMFPVLFIGAILVRGKSTWQVPPAPVPAAPVTRPL